jgi:uncharacterized Zn ribbon protein
MDTTIDEDVESRLCAWCEAEEGVYTDLSEWVCRDCVKEYNLNTNRPEVNGFIKWQTR